MQFFFLTAENLSPEWEAQISELFSQLTPAPPTAVRQVLLHPQNFVAVCTLENQIVGMASMAVYELISGKKAWIEDVVVSHLHRRKGIGEALIKMLLEKCQALHIPKTMLYSSTQRTAAHQLYQKLGFTQRNSLLFQLSQPAREPVATRQI